VDINKVQKRIISLSKYIKEIALLEREGRYIACIYPDFQALQDQLIINIRSEILWYGLELYNMEVPPQEGIREFEIFSSPLAKKPDGSYDKEKLLAQLQKELPLDVNNSLEIQEPLCKALCSFIATLTPKELSPDAHFELDLGLDSLDYVALFTYVEESFGVVIDEEIFARHMRLEELYRYIKKHQKFFAPKEESWGDIIHQDLKEELVYSPVILTLYKTLLYPLFKLYFSFDVQGVEKIPHSSCIIAPTHESMLDGFLIESSLPYKTLYNTFFLAYEGVFGKGMLEPISKHGQLLLIDANKNLKRSMQRAALALKAKKNIVIFPEGARSRDGKLLEFRPFFAMLAKEFNVPIVPVHIDGSFEALRAGALLPRPVKIKVEYLDPIEPDDLSYEALSQKVRSAIEQKLL